MQFHRDAGADVHLIKACGDEGILIGEQLLDRSCIVSADTLISEWKVGSLAELDVAALAPLLELQPELVLLGTGQRLRFPAAEISRYVTGQKVGFEVMDTPAACRTYNVLTNEGRHVVAALIIEKSQESLV